VLLACIVGGCGKAKPKDDGLAVKSAGKAKSKTSEEAPGEKTKTPAPDFLWKGNGTEPMADSFGPMGPAPMLLFGTMIARGNAEVTGSEVGGILSMALPYMIDLRYERDDDITAEWVKLIPPAANPQFFAGMAVWGKVNWALAGATGEDYEAESAIYLTTTSFDQVVAQYTEAYGEKWRKMEVPPAAQASCVASASFLFRSPDEEGLKEVDIARFDEPAVTQVTLSRTVAVSSAVLNGLLNFKPEQLDVEIPEAPPEEKKAAEEKTKSTEGPRGENELDQGEGEKASKSAAESGKTGDRSSPPEGGETKLPGAN